MSSSESDGERVWKRRAAPARQESVERSFWASPPKAKRLREVPQMSSKSGSNARKCLIPSCNYQVSCMHKHVKFHHLPIFASKEVDCDNKEKWESYLNSLATRLKLQNRAELLDFVCKNRLHHSDSVDMTQLDSNNINQMAEHWGEQKDTDLQLRRISKQCHLIHWTVLARLVGSLSDRQSESIEQDFPSPALANKIENKQIFIFGDSIVRDLHKNLLVEIPVTCAPGVCMCKPDQEKWCARLWLPVVETLLENCKKIVPPHLVFHLGTNNISNSPHNAAREVDQEARQLCSKVWHFNKHIHITFSGVLPRSRFDQEAVMAVNHKLRLLAEANPRISFVDFGRELSLDRFYGKDQVHLNYQGKVVLGSCLSMYLSKLVSNADV